MAIFMSVPAVSEQVYRVYQHYERKEEYFSYDLKTEKFQKETATFLPSREDSYERLLEQDKQFAAPAASCATVLRLRQPTPLQTYCGAAALTPWQHLRNILNLMYVLTMNS